MKKKFIIIALVLAVSAFLFFTSKFYWTEKTDVNLGEISFHNSCSFVGIWNELLHLKFKLTGMC